MIRRLLPTDSWVRACLAPVLIFFATAGDRNYLADFWHHLARGRAIVESGGMVDHDLFTYTVPGRPFQDTNWLSQVLYYALYQAGGLDLVLLANALVLAAMMGLLVWVCWRACGSVGVAGAVAVFTFLGLWQVLTVRPQTFSLLLFVVLYALLDGARRRPWLLGLAPCVMALWVNLHGGFPIGLVLIGGFALASAWEGATAEAGAPVSRRLRLAAKHSWPFAVCVAAGGLATLLNPYGWKVYQYVGTTSATATGRRIDEWLPPSLDLLIGKLWAVSLLLTLVAFALPKRRPAARDVILLAVFLPLACGSARMIVWWLLVLAPVLAAQFAAQLPRPEAAPARPSWAAAATFAGLLAVAALGMPGLAAYNPLRRPAPRLESELQTVAEQVAACRGNGRVFCRFEWGEYLGWALPPRGSIFMDGRIEIYPDDVWAAYAAVTSGRANWEAVLDSYGVDVLVLDAAYHAGTGLLPQVQRSAGWQRAGQTPHAVLFVRKPTATP